MTDNENLQSDKGYVAFSFLITEDGQAICLVDTETWAGDVLLERTSAKVTPALGMALSDLATAAVVQTSNDPGTEKVETFRLRGPDATP